MFVFGGALRVRRGVLKPPRRPGFSRDDWGCDDRDGNDRVHGNRGDDGDSGDGDGGTGNVGYSA
ncbi:hypothetical protein [Bifidobacterium jacchi]|uniref:Uncharacterized protein n=1 Tax=Bifidobacterium jacchi TaxID=2490545 RepID=A0A5N5RKA8_9BIFI|nr:hypothetical protein [Bifidobacterium jacchi]KAB5607752.1 hypothetical protein EHS19_03765 [Bifidobacterium jacchi]